MLSAFDPVGNVEEESLATFQEYVTNVVQNIAPQSIKTRRDLTIIHSTYSHVTAEICW